MKIKKQYTAYILIFLVTLVYVTDLFIYRSKLGNFAVQNNTINHTFEGMIIYDEILADRINNFSDLMFYMKSWPNHEFLYHLTFAVSAILFKKNISFMLLFCNLPYLLIMLIFIRLLSVYFGGKNSANYSMVIFSLYPAVFFSFRIFSQEFALTAILILSLYLFIRSEFLSKPGWTFLFAISCAWGMLIKIIFLLFILGPGIMALYYLIKDIKKGEFTRLLNLSGFLFLFLLLISPQYLTDWKISRIIYTSTSEEIISGKWYYWENLSIYFIGVMRSLIGLPFALLLIYGLIKNFRWPISKITILFILVIVISDLIYIATPRNTFLRYLIPQLPILAIVSTSALNESKYRKILLFFVVIIGIFQHLDLSYGKKPRIYFTRSMQICNFTDLKRNSETADSIKNYINNKIVSKKETAYNMLFMPVAENEINKGHIISDIVNSMFWFNNLSVKKMFIKDNNIKGVESVFQNNKADFIVDIINYKISGKTYIYLDDPKYTDILIENLQNFTAFTSKELFVHENYSWDKLRIFWTRFIENYKVRKMLYSDENYELWIYSKK